MDKLQQIKICFLFMHADGEISSAETKYLDEIIKKGNISNSDLIDFDSFCMRMSLEFMIDTHMNIVAKIDELLEGDLYWSKTTKVQTIWTLINLGYADGEYSDAEKQIVNHMVERWEIDPVLAAEFTDTADTILALTLQKEWIQTTSKPYAKIHSIIEELDRNIAAMFDNIKTSISEADIA